MKQPLSKEPITFDEREYGSGDIVEPGTYVDVETGSVVLVQLADQLPEGRKVIEYRRRFKKVTRESMANRKHAHQSV